MSKESEERGKFECQHREVYAIVNSAEHCEHRTCDNCPEDNNRRRRPISTQERLEALLKELKRTAVNPKDYVRVLLKALNDETEGKYSIVKIVEKKE